jgi:transcriptional regulator with XRE-family HTH domain
MSRKTKEMPIRGDRLREARERQGFSQRELAERCHIGESQIFRYENGKGDPSADYLARIARELRVSADWLIGLDEKSPEISLSRTLTPDQLRLLNAYDDADVDTIIDLVKERVGKLVRERLEDYFAKQGVVPPPDSPPNSGAKGGRK